MIFYRTTLKYQVHTHIKALRVTPRNLISVTRCKKSGWVVAPFVVVKAIEASLLVHGFTSLHYSSLMIQRLGFERRI